MYERLRGQSLPFPFYTLPTQGGITTLDFLPAMTALLEQLNGLAATAHAGSLSDELATQELTQALFIMKEYSESALVLFARWHATVHPTPTVEEE